MEWKEPLKATELKMISTKGDSNIKMPKISLPRSFVTPEIKDDKAKDSNRSRKDDSRVPLSKPDYLLSLSGISPDHDADFPKLSPNFQAKNGTRVEPHEPAVDTAAADRLEEEKRQLQQQLKRLLDRRRELEQLPKGQADTLKGFPVDRLHDFEEQMNSLVTVESAKKTEIYQLKQKLKEKLAGKHKGLVDLETLKQKILKKKDDNHLLLLELDGKKSDLVHATLNSNAQIENTLNTPEDFRLLRYFKENSFSSPSSKTREYSPAQISLTVDSLPRGLISDPSDNGYLRSKFLISKKKGIFFEDENLKVALKYAVRNNNAVFFVMRFINLKPKMEWISTVFLNQSHQFRFSVDKRVFEIEPKEFYDLDFEITSPPLDELPVLQLKTKRGEQASLVITNISLPITANWYYPLLRVTNSQFLHFWNSGHGYLQQTEMREIDGAIFAGENDLLALIDNLIPVKDAQAEADQDRIKAKHYGATMQLTFALAAIRITINHASYFFIEVLSDKRDAELSRHIAVAYLFALSKFIVD